MFRKKITMMDACRRTLLIFLAAGSILASGAVHEAVGEEGSRRVIEIRIEDRKVVAPAGAIRVRENDDIALRWRSDETVELHLHGYDKKLRLRPGEPAAMSITAHATGRFPITSHGWGKQGHGHNALIFLEVHPR